MTYSNERVLIADTERKLEQFRQNLVKENIWSARKLNVLLSLIEIAENGNYEIYTL